MKVIRHEDRLWVSVEDHQKAVEFARIAAAIVEREECANLCEEIAKREVQRQSVALLDEAVAAIRARGDK